VLSHRDPKQLHRLTRCLDELYEPAAIACHHDFGRCQLNRGSFPKSVVFVEPHVITRWGTMSIVLAGLLALRRLYTVADPDWFVMLSASDYPVRDPHVVLRDLYTSCCDAFLDHREIRDSQADATTPIISYAQPEWSALAYRRYVVAPASGQCGSPFGPYFRCFAGEQWLTASRRAARVLLNAAAAPSSVLQHFSKCLVPDEAVYHTILCNDPRLTVCSDNHRYTDWSSAGRHPKELGMGDLPIILASTAHFARKFRVDSDVVLRQLDERLGLTLTT
jgi:hypothetical protein